MEKDKLTLLQKWRPKVKVYDQIEEIWHSITHGTGAIIGAIASIFLIIKAVESHVVTNILATSIYSISLVLLFTMSCLYHFFKPGKLKYVFQHFDHVSIYLLIAGTYTPIALCGLKNMNLFIFIWLISLVGIYFKVFHFKKYNTIHLLVFLLMGWIAVFFMPEIINTFPLLAVLWLMFGGLFYSVGVLFYAFRFFKFNHVVWHAFVLLGAIAHYIMIFKYII